jgi:hypothetical protein
MKPTHDLQALQQGNNDGARIYASNAIRKKSEVCSTSCA